MYCHVLKSISFALAGSDLTMLYSETVLTAVFLPQVHSPLNLKHPHDVVIFMRQDARVNYLKKLEVCQLHFIIIY